MNGEVLDLSLNIMNGLLLVYGFSAVIIALMLCKFLPWTPGIFLLLFGIFVLARCIIGIVGIIKKKERILFIYIILIPLLWVMCLIVGAVLYRAIANSEYNITDWLMKLKLNDINNFHDIERQYSCCGLKGAIDYGDKVESACCDTSLAINEKDKGKCLAIAKRRSSCPTVIHEMVHVFIMSFSFSALIFTTLEIACLVFAIKRYKQLRKVEISD